MRQDDSSHFPAARLARILMDQARQDPSLLGRSRAEMESSLIEAGEQPIALPDASCSVSEYLENLVMIAVESSRDAEATYREACETNRRSRRRELVAAALCVVGVLAGVTGAVTARLHADTEAQLAQVTATLQSLDERQHQTNGRLAELQSNVDTAVRDEAPAVSQPQPMTIPVNGVDSTGADQQGAHHSARGYRPVVFPQFFSAVRRDMYALLR
jgi:cell division protein FtsB